MEDDIVNQHFKTWIKQVNRGYLELLILKLLEKEEKYGWDLLSTIRAIQIHSNLTEGTLYGLLKRLEQKSIVKSVIKKSEDGRNRRYFSLTSTGLDLLNLMIETWKNMDSTVNEFIH